MPTTKTTKTTKTSARELVAGLSDSERAELLAELRAEQTATAAAELVERDLTPRERAIRELLRERDHLENCPLVEDERRAIGRVEAYNEVRPANLKVGRMVPEPVTVARCIECGGSRLLEGRLEENLIRVLEPAADDGELDVELT
jgi:hypothetical protein